MILMLSTNMTIMSLIMTTTSSTMYSAMWLIMAFMNASLLLLMLEMEFIASLTMMMYAGAIAMLFLFAIMMINMNNTYMYSNNEKTYMLPLSMTSLVMIWKMMTKPNKINSMKYLTLNNENNMEKMSDLLYQNYSPWLILNSAMLLMSMMTTMMMMQKENHTSLKQELFKQLQRNDLMQKNSYISKHILK